MSAPVYVLPTADQVNTLARQLNRDGWTIKNGFQLPDTPWDLGPQRLLLTGLVTDDNIADVVLAAARGAGLIVSVPAASTTEQVLLDDLRRIGPVSRTPAASTDGALTDEQRALLAHLANGQSIAQAADAEFLSLRTANRRIAQARSSLGVRTTREAVVEYLRLHGSP